MVLPENLTTLASNSEANRQYHQEMATLLPWLGLDDTITVGQTTHLTDHEKLHNAVDRGLRKGSLNGLTGHGADHNIIHAYCNTTYQSELHVTKGGNDSNPGTWASPKLTIGAAVTAAMAANASGQTTRIRVHATAPGTTTVYREFVDLASGGTTAAMVLEAAEDGVVISGADDWTGGWTTHDAPNRIYYKTWTNNWGVQAWPDSAWQTRAGTEGWTDIIRRREMVIIDGVWVRQVLTLAEIDDYDAAYYVDEAADRLYIRIPTGGNIATIPVEVAMRERTLLATSRTNLTVRGLTFQHAATVMQNPGVFFTGCVNPVAEDLICRQNSWSGLASNFGSGGAMRRIDASHNGVLGASSFRGNGQTWEDSTFNFNNTLRGAWANFIDWEDGGTKAFEVRSHTIRRCDAMDNNSNGFWWDTDCADLVCEDSRAARNARVGITSEISQGPMTIRRNKINDNFRGISLTSTKNVTIDDNELWDNGIELQAVTPAGTNFTLNAWADWSGGSAGQLEDMDPVNWTVTNNLVWASSAKADKYIGIFPPNWSNGAAEGWRTTLTAGGNAYYSTVNANPFSRRNSDESFTTINFTDWKTYLGGSRDSTSTFSSSPPSPAPTL